MVWLENRNDIGEKIERFLIEKDRGEWGVIPGYGKRKESVSGCLHKVKKGGQSTTRGH